MIAAFVGAAPMLGLVFFILFSCTLLGLVQRCKINLTKSYANRRKSIIRDRLSIDLEDLDSSILFKPATDNVIISPFDDIPMQDIDADSASKSYSEPKGNLFINSSITEHGLFIQIFQVFDEIEVLMLVQQAQNMIMVLPVFLMIMIMNKIDYPL